MDSAFGLAGLLGSAPQRHTKHESPRPEPVLLDKPYLERSENPRAVLDSIRPASRLRRAGRAAMEPLLIISASRFQGALHRAEAVQNHLTWDKATRSAPVLAD